MLQSIHCRIDQGESGIEQDTVTLLDQVVIISLDQHKIVITPRQYKPPLRPNRTRIVF